MVFLIADIILLLLVSTVLTVIVLITVQVFLPQKPTEDIMADMMTLGDGSNKDMQTLLADGNYQAASAKIFAAASIVNVPTEMVTVT